MFRLELIMGATLTDIEDTVSNVALGKMIMKKMVQSMFKDDGIYLK